MHYKTLVSLLVIFLYNSVALSVRSQSIAPEELWPYPKEIAITGDFAASEALQLIGVSCAEHLREDLKTIGKVELIECTDAYRLELCIDSNMSRAEEYVLVMTAEGALLKGSDKAAVAHGLQTLLQIMVAARQSKKWPVLEIHDWPTYRKRGFMVDMGRSVLTMPMLKRVVRILSRLKMNQLHLHLYDDELCGLKYRGLPFGRENPYAITVEELGELVKYAADYNIEIVPELEAWGHVGSLVFHRPELRGGPGMFGGSSFLFCEDTFNLMEQLIYQVAQVMPKTATIHLGLDEAKWFVSPDMPKDFSPKDMLRRYYRIVKKIGGDLNKELTMALWADHSGRPVPEEIKSDIIIEPWMYWNSGTDAIDKSIKKYSGKDKMRWTGGAGISVCQYRGAYHATRYWCQKASKSPNVEGITICFWGTNDLNRRFISLFAGSYFLWNPFPPTAWATQQDYERFDSVVFPYMYRWQSNFRDAYPDAIVNDRGPIVTMGYYHWGEKHGQPVAPTVLGTDTAPKHF